MTNKYLITVGEVKEVILYWLIGMNYYHLF